MDFIISICHYLLIHRFGFLVASILFVVFMQLIIKQLPIKKSAKTTLKIASALCIWASLLFFIFGMKFTNGLIYKNGKTGKAQVINEANTGDMYNEEPVLKYTVLIKTKSGETFETSFESLDFNIYPELENVDYPSLGVTFHVKYMENNPDVFIIVSNDDSPYALQMHCSKLLLQVNTAKSKYNFDPSNQSYKKDYKDALKVYLSDGCNKKDAIYKSLELELQRL